MNVMEIDSRQRKSLPQNSTESKKGRIVHRFAYDNEGKSIKIGAKQEDYTDTLHQSELVGDQGSNSSINSQDGYTISKSTPSKFVLSYDPNVHHPLYPTPISESVLHFVPIISGREISHNGWKKQDNLIGATHPTIHYSSTTSSLQETADTSQKRPQPLFSGSNNSSCDNHSSPFNSSRLSSLQMHKEIEAANYTSLTSDYHLSGSSLRTCHSSNPFPSSSAHYNLPLPSPPSLPSTVPLVSPPYLSPLSASLPYISPSLPFVLSSRSTDLDHELFLNENLRGEQRERREEREERQISKLDKTRIKSASREDPTLAKLANDTRKTNQKETRDSLLSIVFSDPQSEGVESEGAILTFRGVGLDSEGRAARSSYRVEGEAVGGKKKLLRKKKKATKKTSGSEQKKGEGKEKREGKDKGGGKGGKGEEGKEKGEKVEGRDKGERGEKGERHSGNLMRMKKLDSSELGVKIHAIKKSEVRTTKVSPSRSQKKTNALNNDEIVLSVRQKFQKSSSTNDVKEQAAEILSNSAKVRAQVLNGSQSLPLRSIAFDASLLRTETSQTSLLRTENSHIPLVRTSSSSLANPQIPLSRSFANGSRATIALETGSRNASQTSPANRTPVSPNKMHQKSYLELSQAKGIFDQVPFFDVKDINVNFSHKSVSPANLTPRGDVSTEYFDAVEKLFAPSLPSPPLHSPPILLHPLPGKTEEENVREEMKLERRHEERVERRHEERRVEERRHEERRVEERRHEERRGEEREEREMLRKKLEEMEKENSQLTNLLTTVRSNYANDLQNYKKQNIELNGLNGKVRIICRVRKVPPPVSSPISPTPSPLPPLLSCQNDWTLNYFLPSRPSLTASKKAVMGANRAHSINCSNVSPPPKLGLKKVTSPFSLSSPTVRSTSISPCVVGETSKPSHQFYFDKILTETSSQGDCFYEVQPIFDAVLSGGDACILAYGLTGSGKTYTLLGDERLREERKEEEKKGEERKREEKRGGDRRVERGERDRQGIVQTAIEKIFEYGRNERLRIKGSLFEIKLKLSMVELYGNNFYDLLSPLSAVSPPSSLPSSPLLSSPELPQVFLKRSSSGEYLLENLTELEFSGEKEEEDAISAIYQGISRRKTGENLYHFHSSRSHLIITIQVEMKSTLPSFSALIPAVSDIVTVTSGRLRIVDLAGCERLKQKPHSSTLSPLSPLSPLPSLLSSERSEESIAINKSLSALADVIHALAADNRTHIPFMNSPLTKFIADSLKSNLLLFACVVPLMEYAQETLHTLQYVSKMKSMRSSINPLVLRTYQEVKRLRKIVSLLSSEKKINQ